MFSENLNDHSHNRIAPSRQRTAIRSRPLLMRPGFPPSNYPPIGRMLFPPMRTRIRNGASIHGLPRLLLRILLPSHRNSNCHPPKIKRFRMISRPGKTIGHRTDNPFLRGLQDHVLSAPTQNPYASTTEEFFVYSFAVAYGRWRDTHSNPIGPFELLQILSSYCPACAEPLWTPKKHR